MNTLFFTRPWSRALLAAAAVLTVFALMTAVEVFVRIRLRTHLDAFGDRMSPAKLSGNVLDSQAFDNPGFLAIFGSSELNRPAQNRPDEFFRRRPTGFDAFTIGRGGTSCLLITQKIAAVGEAARGKKVVIILSPSWFLKDRVTLDAVKGNLAPLQLGSWIFGGCLSDALKARIARRLLEYPNALDRQPLIVMALENLATGGASSRLRLAALTPIGIAQNIFLGAHRLRSLAAGNSVVSKPARAAPGGTRQWPRRRGTDSLGFAGSAGGGARSRTRQWQSIQRGSAHAGSRSEAAKGARKEEGARQRGDR